MSRNGIYRGFLYAGSTKGKLIKLSEVCGSRENTIDYFLQKQLCNYKHVFPFFSNWSKKFKRVCVEGELDKL